MEASTPPPIVEDYLRALEKVRQWQAARRPSLTAQWLDRAQRALDVMTSDAARLALRLAGEKGLKA